MFEKLEAVQVNTFDVKSQLPRLVHERAMQAAAAGELARTAISNLEELKQRQQQIRMGIDRCLGELPASHSPLNPTITGTVMGGNYRIEKVIFESRPSVYVTGNLYVPDGILQPRGAVLFLCGHREQAKHCDEYQTVCQYLVQAGLIVLAIDPVGQGERFGYYDPIAKEAAVTSVLEHERVGRQCLPVGDSLARYMLHDAVRAIDYLCSRPEVDQSRIGVTGHSGGGTQTALVMMYDTRIAAAAPGGFIMNRPHFLLTGKTQDAEQKWPGFSALGFDHEDIILAMAPRPVLILATQYDSVPIEGTRQNVEVNSRFWEMCGCPDKLELFVDEDVHRFTIPLALAAAGFFSQHLLGQRVLPAGDQIALHAAEQLWCTKSGQIIGEMEQAKNVHQENVERLTQFELARQSIADVERKRIAIEWLRGKVTGSRHPYALNPRHYASGEHEGMRVTRSIWWSQHGLLNMALQFSDMRLADRKLPVSIGIWEGGIHSLQAHAEWIQETCGSGRLALVLNPTGIGPLLPHLNSPQDNPFKQFGVLDKHTDELMWLDDSMAAVRTYDVLRAVELAAELRCADSSDIRLYGGGKYAIYAGFAGLIEPAIREIRMKDRMPSIADWVKETSYDPVDSLSFIIPGMLRLFDLPDLDGWLADEGRLFAPAGRSDSL